MDGHFGCQNRRRMTNYPPGTGREEPALCGRWPSSMIKSWRKCQIWPFGDIANSPNGPQRWIGEICPILQNGHHHQAPFGTIRMSGRKEEEILIRKPKKMIGENDQRWGTLGSRIHGQEIRRVWCRTLKRCQMRQSWANFLKANICRILCSKCGLCFSKFLEIF